MDVAPYWIISVIGPAILLIILVWLVMKRAANHITPHTEVGTRKEYVEEEERGQEGTDRAEK